MSQILLNCKKCKKGFWVYPYRAYIANCCSYKCRNSSYEGRKHSKITRLKMSKAHTGRPPTKTSFKKGYKRSEEVTKKIHKALLGRKLSESHRKKLSGYKEGRFNHPVSVETRNKIRTAMLKTGHKPPLWGSLKGRMVQNRTKKPTSIEKKVYDELKVRGILFETQKLINGHFVVDAYIPSLNLIIEADGDYWHSLPEVVSRDKRKNSYLETCGYNLLRLPESIINNGEFIKDLERVLN